MVSSYSAQLVHQPFSTGTYTGMGPVGPTVANYGGSAPYPAYVPGIVPGFPGYGNHSLSASMQPAYLPGSQEISPPSPTFPSVPAPAVRVAKPESNSDSQVWGTVVHPPGSVVQTVPPSSVSAPHAVPTSLGSAPQAVPTSSTGVVQLSAVQQPARREPGESATSRPRKAQVKLMPFNGEGSLETFLAKFENMSRYLGWGESDRFYHLCSSVNGTAGQVLWDAGSQADTKSVIDLLRTCFGMELQAEHFKAN